MSFALIVSLILCSMVNVMESAEQRMLRHKSAQQVLDAGVRSYQGTMLYFPYHQVTTLNDLPLLRQQFQCDTLTEINVQHNHLMLSDLITVLTQAPNLESLDFSHNQVQEVRDIPPHGNLVTIQLNDNHIKRFDFKNFFTSLSGLRTSLMHNNPLYADGVVNMNGSYPVVKEAWFDQRVFTPRTLTACTKRFPNLDCELVPGSNAVQERVGYETHYISGFERNDFILLTITGATIGALLGSLYGIGTICYWMTPKDRVSNIVTCGTVGAGVGVTLFCISAKVWNMLCCESRRIRKRYIDSQPLLLHASHRYEGLTPGQEESFTQVLAE